jgi:octaprenyl-diphosphate synthase
MQEFAKEALGFIDECVKPELQDSFKAYLDFVIKRNK